MDAGKEWAELQPRLAAAAREERDIRSSAWLDLPLDICGIPVEPLTLRRYAVLAAASNPFIVGGTRTAGAIAQFLWIVSREFCVDEKKKRKFLKRIGGIKAGTAIIEISLYMEAAFFDAPMGKSRTGSVPSTALEASIIHQMGDAYGWTPDQILDQPLGRLFQLMRIQDRINNPNSASFSPMQDRIKQEFLQKINERGSN